MKPFSQHREEKTTSINLSGLLHSLMMPESSYGSLEDVKLEGRNFGATMVTRRSCTGESHDCCNINIYVSNNVQGVNNSILVGSEVRMGDPGVSLVLKDLEFDRGYQKSSKKKISESVVSYCLVSVFTIITLLLLQSAI